MQNELAQKRHTQLQLPDLLHTPAGEQLAALFADRALLPFTAAGMHVAAWELVLSQHNTQPKPSYKGYHIANKLGCQHQDLRGNEPWMDERVRGGARRDKSLAKSVLSVEAAAAGWRSQHLQEL